MLSVLERTIVLEDFLVMPDEEIEERIEIRDGTPVRRSDVAFRIESLGQTGLRQHAAAHHPRRRSREPRLKWLSARILSPS